MREQPLNEFELQEIDSTKTVVSTKIAEIKEGLTERLASKDVKNSGEILLRIDNLEHSSIVFETKLTPLTPTSDIDDVKAMLNTIIGAINKD